MNETPVRQADVGDGYVLRAFVDRRDGRDGYRVEAESPGRVPVVLFWESSSKLRGMRVLASGEPRQIERMIEALRRGDPFWEVREARRMPGGVTG